MNESRKFVITLVHGTFDRGSTWAQPGSPFCKAIETMLPGAATFYSHPWSGQNTQAQRRAVSTALKAQLLEQRALHRDAHHFLIGHSHGGNIGLYALDDDKAQSSLDGAICINTPFITVTRRHTQNLVIFLVSSFALVFVALAIMIAIVAACIALVWLSEHRGVDVQDPRISLMVALFLAPIGWLSWVLLKGRANIDAYFQRVRDDFVRRTVLPTILRPPVLCLWSSGDEVYGAFSLFEGLANIPYILMHTAFCILIFFPLPLYTLSSAWEWLPQYVSYLLATQQTMLQLLLALYGATAIAGGLLIYGLLSVAAYLLVLAGIAVPLNFLLRIVPVGISLADLFSSFFVRLSFSFLPLTARHVQFSELTLPLQFLNHSAPYKSEEAIRIMADWITARSSPAAPASAARDQLQRP